MSAITESIILEEMSQELDDDIILGDDYGDIIDMMMEAENALPNFPISREERSVNVNEMSLCEATKDILKGVDCWGLKEEGENTYA